MPPEREIAITKAIDAIQNGQVGSVRAATSKFGVPRTTLQSRLHGTTDRSTAQQITQKLTGEQEQCLVDWIKVLETQGNAHSHTMVCNVRGRGSLSHYLVYSESLSQWCLLAIILLVYLHHNLLLVSNRSIQNTYRLVILAVLTLLSLSCSLERFVFEYYGNLSKTRRYTCTRKLPLNFNTISAIARMVIRGWAARGRTASASTARETGESSAHQIDKKHASIRKAHVVTCKICWRSSARSPGNCSTRGASIRDENRRRTFET
jgi:hypothetical protein